MANSMSTILLQNNLEIERRKAEVKKLTVEKAELERENKILKDENAYLKELLKVKGREELESCYKGY